MIDLKKNKLSVYVPAVAARMLDDISNTYAKNTSSVISKSLEMIYPQAMLKIRFTEWALCAMVNNRFDLLRFQPADSDGFVCISTDFVEIPDNNGNTQLVGTFNSSTQDVIDNQPVVKTWTEYKSKLDSVVNTVSPNKYIVNMYDSTTNEFKTEHCDEIGDARTIAREFYAQKLCLHPDAVESTFVDNVNHRDVYTLKVGSNVITVNIIPV